jgi:hypothetical protein
MCGEKKYRDPKVRPYLQGCSGAIDFVGEPGIHKNKICGGCPHIFSSLFSWRNRVWHIEPGSFVINAQ